MGENGGARTVGPKGWARRKRTNLKEQKKSRRRTGPGVARRNSSLVKGAIIQGIAPSPQTGHKLWAFNFAILTGRSDEWQAESTSRAVSPRGGLFRAPLQHSSLFVRPRTRVNSFRGAAL